MTPTEPHRSAPFRPDPHAKVAVIFISQRNGADDENYQATAAEMEALAKDQPGFAGVFSARNADGSGITVSYWDSEAAARAWRDHPRHTEVRNQGRGLWYDYYHIDVAQMGYSHDWARDAA